MPNVNNSITGGITGQGNIPANLQEGLYGMVGLFYDRWEKEYDKMLDVRDSDKAYELIAIDGGFGRALVKPEGAGIEYSNQQQIGLARFVNVTYALGTIITMEAIEDNLYQDMMEDSARMLATSINDVKEVVAANLFNDGYNAAFPIWDGQPLFSANHPLGKSAGTFSNVLPTPADLSEEALEDACTIAEEFVDPAGILLRAKVTSLHVPTPLGWEAERILGSPLNPGTNNNAINAIRSRKSITDGYYVQHYLDDPKNWFIRTDVPKGGMFFVRNDMMQGQDNDFGTSNYRHKALTRFNVGCADPRGYVGSGEIVTV